MAIFKDDNEITSIYKGNRAIALVYKGAMLVWSLIRSCFGKGLWINDYSWNNNDGWKNNNE
jgi:hypothetical protein